MSEEFFDVAVINFDKYILHGRIIDGYEIDEDGIRYHNERYIEQELTGEQKRAIWELETRHRLERDDLLASFVVR